MQRNFESCMQEIQRMERSKKQTATMWAMIVGVIGTVFMAGSVFAVTSEPPHYVLMILLASSGDLLVGYFLCLFTATNFRSKAARFSLLSKLSTKKFTSCVKKDILYCELKAGGVFRRHQLF